MLHEFLQENRNEILELCAEKSKELAGNRTDSEKLRLGLPKFFEQLIKVLALKLNNQPQTEMLASAALHGHEFLILGFSLSHVVHSYGSMCQSITELASRKNANISAAEFNILNGCLDIAIASAVSEFQFRNNEAIEERELKHLGFLAHELRNALSSATIAHDMIKAGLVGAGGSTAGVLETNLVRMRNLIDRSLSEVRMRADSDLFVTKFRLSDLFDQIVITAKIDASKRQQLLVMEVDTQIMVEADRQYLVSAVANLLQNAIKYTKSRGLITLRGKMNEGRIFIEVQDECGGLKIEKINSLFQPFVKENADRSGLGLGLTITQRAVYLSQGTIRVTNNPGSGCMFVIDIPQSIGPLSSNKTAVSGVNSVQPLYTRQT